MTVAVGDRVGAVVSATEETVRLYGYGVYEGQQELGLDVPGVAGFTGRQLLADAQEAGATADQLEMIRRRKNPRIRLDNGGVVWGCQCWWGPEAAVRASIGDRTVEVVPVPGAES